MQEYDVSSHIMVYEPISQSVISQYYDMKGNMPKKMANIKEILAANLRENRRKKGLTQEKLAEMADISLRYLAMLELGKNFPSGEVIEKLAKALDIQAFQLFYPTATTEGASLHGVNAFFSEKFGGYYSD